MSDYAVLAQQVINGLSLGAMYALLALGFTLVYGILELINFAHFNVFMVASFIGMWALQLLGISGQSRVLTGMALAGTLLFAFVVTMVGAGIIGVVIERLSLRPLRGVRGTAAMITTIGVSYILFNIILLTAGAGSENFPNPLPVMRWHLGSIAVAGFVLIGILAFAFFFAVLAAGILGPLIKLAADTLGLLLKRLSLPPLRAVPGTPTLIATIGFTYVVVNVVLLTVRASSQNWELGQVTIELRELLIWTVALALMIALHFFVSRTRLGKAMRATAQDPEAARMMGVDVDRVIATAFFLGSALAGAAALIFGLYYNYTSFIIGYTAGLRAFTAAVLGGIGSIPGAMVGGLLIGLIETLGGQLIAVRWTDVIIFSILVLVLVFFPTGLMGRATPTKS